LSSHHETTLPCPGCGSEQPFTVWDSVNVTIDPELKSRLLNGELTTFECPQCGRQAPVSHDCLYHDMAAALMIWVKGSQEHDSPAEPSLPGLPPLTDSHTLRVVDSLNELIEKVRIADDGYTDHLIELLKLNICLGEEIDLSSPFYYDETEAADVEGEGSVMFVAEVDGELRELSCASADLATVASMLPRLQQAIDGADSSWPRVDRHYMLDLLDKSGLLD
jgi:hypothetical protein